MNSLQKWHVNLAWKNLNLLGKSSGENQIRKGGGNGRHAQNFEEPNLKGE